MLFESIVGLAILAAITSIFIKKYVPEFSFVFTAAAGCLILILISLGASGFLNKIEEVFTNSGIDKGVFTVVLKSLGICYISSFAAELCRDFGQTSLAAKVELAGKISVLVLTLPMIKQILNVAVTLIG